MPSCTSWELVCLTADGWRLRLTTGLSAAYSTQERSVVTETPAAKNPASDSSHGSVTQWLADLKVGDERQAGDELIAQQQLWNRYFNRLVALARMKLGNAPRAAEDEEDVALSALESLFHGVANERFPKLDDRGNLWSLLAKITACKAINQRDRQLAKKRGGGKPALRLGSPLESTTTPFELIDQELGPDFLVAMQEECQRLMRSLEDETLQTIASRKLEGYSSAEIAQELGVVERTVERKLALIRARWLPEASELSDE